MRKDRIGLRAQCTSLVKETVLSRTTRLQPNPFAGFLNWSGERACRLTRIGLAGALSERPGPAPPLCGAAHVQTRGCNLASQAITARYGSERHPQGLARPATAARRLRAVGPYAIIKLRIVRPRARSIGPASGSHRGGCRGDDGSGDCHQPPGGNSLSHLGATPARPGAAAVEDNQQSQRY
jgi:hypothetical protein